MRTLTIDKKWIRHGFASHEDGDDGGLSPIYKGFNHWMGKGDLLYPQPVGTEISGVLQDDILAGCYDPTWLGDEAFFVDDDGNFYDYDSGTLTLRQTDSAKSYVEKTTNMVVVNGSILCTSTTDIAKLPANMSSIDHDWWTDTMGMTALNSVVRHPMVVIEGTAYIMDGEKIHTYDGLSTAVYEAMALSPDENITAAGKHPDGRHLIVFTFNTLNASHTYAGIAKCYVIDTVTLEFVQEIILEQQIEGYWLVGGVPYVTYGNKLGYFDGNGIKFLRYLGNSTTYTPLTAPFNGSLLIPEDEHVLAYGDVNGRGNIFHYPYSHGSENISFLMPVSADELAVCYNDSGRKLRILDYSATNDFDTKTFQTIKHSFGQTVWIRRVDIYFKGNVATGTDSSVFIVDRNGTAHTVGTLSYGTDGAINKKEKMMCNIRTDIFSLRATIGTFYSDPAFEKAIIYYEPE